MPPLGKCEENGTITNNRSATIHEPLENSSSWNICQLGINIVQSSDNK